MPAPRSTTNQTESRLLLLAALFLFLFALALTLSPAARARTWAAEYRWAHWIGYLIWLGGAGIVHRQAARHLPRRDPYLLPVAAALAGWGLLTIWRLTPYYGARQTVWLALGMAVLALGVRLPADLRFLRRYKYLWLTGGLLLTALTLLLGTNPMGFGPRMWLGCCGVYLQPSEMLKLLLIVFLAAYFGGLDYTGDNGTRGTPRLALLTPTLILTGVALLVLLVQRDLGTASIFIFLYAVMLFLATGWRWIPALAALMLAAGGALGYLLFDVVRLRVEAWLNPWLDPSGRSYQIVQSLIAVANGGVFGRGPGMGSPNFVPVAHSDFIFAALAEETGMAGALGLLALLGVLLYRGVLAALRSRTPFHRLLAAGLTAFLAGQSVLIIGGNLRLLPLTGVTLPLVSYGGSSLVVSLSAVLLLLLITGNEKPPAVRHPSPAAVSAPYTALAAFLLLALTALALVDGWWAFARGPALLARTDNPRRALADRYVYRGALLTRGNLPLAETAGAVGGYTRRYRDPALGPVIGYNHPVYGLAGLEASLDPTLRGLQGNDPLTIWRHHLLYGQPPPGLDIRLTLDPGLQSLADDLLAGRRGALILLNAGSGEILVMASHPGFDANLLDETWDILIADPQAPLVNRVTQGRYRSGNLGTLPFMEAAARPEIPPVTLRLPLAATDFPEEATPLEVAFAAAAVSNRGERPAARLTLSYRHPSDGWRIFPPLGDPVQLLDAAEAENWAAQHRGAELPIWQAGAVLPGEGITWYLGGTLPEGHGIPLVLVVVLEEAGPFLAEEIGTAVLGAAIGQ